MSTSNFFNILHKYFRCCICRCCKDKSQEEITDSDKYIIYNKYGGNNPFTFDDVSSPSTNITWSSSSSSLDSLNERRHTSTYKRKNINISIIPSYYYHSD